VANPVIALVARFLRAARQVREDRGDPREDDVAVRAAAEEDELEEIEEEEEEG
jgi:hypothetical protein